MTMKLHQLYDLRGAAQRAGDHVQVRRLQAAIDARNTFIGAPEHRLGAARQADIAALDELERNHPELFTFTGASQ